MSSANILVVEDDKIVIKVLQSQLEAAGYKVVGAANAAETIRATVLQQPDLMILDLTLDDGISINGLRDGLTVLDCLRRTLPEANYPVIIHTADTSNNFEERARSLGVSAVFRKGSPVTQLVAAVRSAMEARKKMQAA
jgi:CheY-like chemotaxis protein